MIKKLFIFSLLLCLYSCTNTKPQRFNTPLWQFEGKFALNFPDNKQTGYIRWQHYNNGFDLNLWGVLGLGTTKVNVYPKQVLINRGQQQKAYKASELNELLPGVSIALLDLVNNANELIRNTERNKKQAINTDSTWQIETLRTKTFNDKELPSKLRLSNGQKQLTLLIKKWH